jgi:Ca2+/Na+ antiporter
MKHNIQLLKKEILSIKENNKKRNFIFIILSIVILIFILSYFKKDLSVLDFSINIFVGILFLLLALYFDQSLEEKINTINELTQKSENALTRREEELESEKRWQRFIHFIENDTNYNIRIPETKTSNHPLGLEYTIEPVRDTKTNQLILYKNSIEQMHIIKIKEPANWDFILSTKENEALIKDYEISPIKVGEFYYCKFFNNRWNLSFNQEKFYEFYLSSKMGEAYLVVSASEFMNNFTNEILNKTEISIFYSNIEPDESNGQGLSKCQIFLDKNTNDVYIKINCSRLKLMYFKNTDSNPENWNLVIENIMGYTHGEKLEILKEKIEKELIKHNIQLVKIPWYHFRS